MTTTSAASALAGIEDYKRLASGGRSDETIFKYTVSLVVVVDIDGSDSGHY